MFADLHLLRPWWLLALIPLFFFILFYTRKKTDLGSWNQACDSHLLPFLMEKSSFKNQRLNVWLLYAASFFMILGLTGPTWTRYSVPAFQKIMPRVILLDLSSNMLNQDLKPSRLSRARYILHDLFNRTDLGQIALVVYSGEPFVVSPLTEDGKTIDALLPMIEPSIMPVEGQNLSFALKEAARLIYQAGFQQGQLLVLTGSPPDEEALAVAKNLAKKGLQTSILPLVNKEQFLPLFSPFAKAGQGLMLALDDPLNNLSQWLQAKKHLHYVLAKNNDIPLWRDEGIWFIFGALIFLWPVFQRNWLLRI